MSDLKEDFIDNTVSETNAGSIFEKSFVSYLLSIDTLLPKEKLVEPKIENLIPMGISENKSLLPVSIVEAFKKKGNILRSNLMEKPKYQCFQMSEKEDATISWDNFNGSKTSLRYIKIGKSTDDHVFLDCLSFLFKTFKSDERPKIFLTLDQALHFKFKSLISLNKMPQEFSNFFIPILDPFHHQWCLLKCLFSAYENTGLKDLLGILAIDEKKWPNLLGESKNVHKAQSILEVLAISLGTFFIDYFRQRLSADEKNRYDSLSFSEKVDLIFNELPQFLDDLSLTDKRLSVYIEIYRFSILVIQCWESQRLANFDMYVNSIKQTLPYLFAFNRFNYQQSTMEFLTDISLLGDYYIDLLKSGVMFETMSTQPGKQVSCGYVLEIYNKIIKQITPNIDGSGSGWLRNLPRLAFIRQILENALQAKLFSDFEKDPIKFKIPNIDHIAKLRWLLQVRNILKIDDAQYSILTRDATHFLTEVIIDKKFLDCKSFGMQAIQDFTLKILDNKPAGSFESIRKNLNIKKLVPFPMKKKVLSKPSNPLSKAEKQTLLANLPEEEIPMSSPSMLSPNNGVSPYLGTKKSESGHFLLNRYATELEEKQQEFDLIIIDFMAFIFTKPPSHIYSAPKPLEEYCCWLVATMLSPLLEKSSTLVVCIDRKDLDNDFPLKCETHKSRKSKVKGVADFTILLSKLLGSNLQLVTDSYIPPYSWMSTDRNIRFQLIYKAFNEIFLNPSKYPFPNKDFKLYVDGFSDNGTDLHSQILTNINGTFDVSSSDFTVYLPEADQSIFFILRKLAFSNCLIKYKDNDILLSAILQCQDICKSENQKLFLQNLESTRTCYDVKEIFASISNDKELSKLRHPVQSLIFALLIIGNNDYSGKIWGMSCNVAFKALGSLDEDLACKIADDCLASNPFLSAHLFSLFASKCPFSISYGSFQKFVKLIYIFKNASLFKGLVKLPMSKNILKWKKNDLISAYQLLNLDWKDSNGKDLLVTALRSSLVSHLIANPTDQNKVDKNLSEGVSPVDIDFKIVQKTLWLNKNPRDWCPNMMQMKNLYGRSVLTGLLFSCPESFPPKNELVKFGFKVESDFVCPNLSSSLTKEKNLRTVLMSVLKKKKSQTNQKGKRKVSKSEICSKAKRNKKVTDSAQLID